MSKRPETLAELINMCGQTVLSVECSTAQSAISLWTKTGLPKQEHNGITRKWRGIAKVAKKLGHEFTRDQIMDLSLKAKAEKV